MCLCYMKICDHYRAETNRYIITSGGQERVPIEFNAEAGQRQRTMGPGLGRLSAARTEQPRGSRKMRWSREMGS